MKLTRFKDISMLVLLFFLKFSTILVSQDEPSYHPLGQWEKNKITSNFGWRYSTWSYHKGIDIDGKLGDNVFAWRSGLVVSSGFSKTKGYHVTIQHQGNLKSKYYHLSKIIVSIDELVNGGEKIGEVGNTGRVDRGSGGDGSHLHFEIHSNGKPQNPRPFLVNSNTVPFNGFQYKTITINSNPSNMNLYINGEDNGKTPKTLKLKHGNYSLKIIGNVNYESLSENISVSNTSQYIYEFELAPVVTLVHDSEEDSSKIGAGYIPEFTADNISVNGYSFYYEKLKSENNILNSLVGEINSYQLGFLFGEFSEISKSIYSGFLVNISVYAAYADLKDKLYYYKFYNEYRSNIVYDELNKFNLLAGSIGYFRTLGFSKIFHLYAGGNFYYGYYGIEGENYNEYNYSTEVSHKIEYFEITGEAGLLLNFKSVLLSASYNHYLNKTEPNFSGIRFGIILNPLKIKK